MPQPLQMAGFGLKTQLGHHLTRKLLRFFSCGRGTPGPWATLRIEPNQSPCQRRVSIGGRAFGHTRVGGHLVWALSIRIEPISCLAYCSGAGTSLVALGCAWPRAAADRLSCSGFISSSRSMSSSRSPSAGRRSSFSSRRQSVISAASRSPCLSRIEFIVSLIGIEGEPQMAPNGRRNAHCGRARRGFA